VVQRVTGDGPFSLAADSIEEQVLPHEAVNPFAGVRFALYGKDTSSFVHILASHGMGGDLLTGKLADADLSKYDVLIMLTNCIMYDTDDELQANADKLREFVHGGGDIVAFQQNGRATWDSSIFPYDMGLIVARSTTKPVLADERLFGGAQADEFGGYVVVYYPIDVAGTDNNWRYLAYADDDKKQGAIAVCKYGQGQALINQFAVLDRIGEPVMRSLMQQTVRYVLDER
ncbi:unnamed protein product, partial [marine sediment metagenome]